MMQRNEYIKTAFSKLAFCIRISANLPVLIRLLRHTKKFARSKTRTLPARYPEQPPVHYRFRGNEVPSRLALRTYAGDIDIFYEIFWRKAYELPRSVFGQARVIVDAGAHVGIAAAYFSLRAPQATLYTIEADDHNQALLLQNLAPQIRSGKGVPLLAALGDREETVYLEKSAFAYNTRISASETAWKRESISMDRLIEKYRITGIDILKIDIEGAESRLFSGHCAWLARVQHILIEIHSEESLGIFLQAVSSHGFSVQKRKQAFSNIYYAARTTGQHPIT